MDSIKASEFKAKCLALMDEVAASGESIVITKHGKPVAELGPVRTRDRKPRSLIGLHKGQVRILGDIISPLDDKWDALEE